MDWARTAGHFYGVNPVEGVEVMALDDQTRDEWQYAVERGPMARVDTASRDMQMLFRAFAGTELAALLDGERKSITYRCAATRRRTSCTGEVSARSSVGGASVSDHRALAMESQALDAATLS